MSNTPTVFVLYPRVPLVRGGTEIVAESLVHHLQSRGVKADLVSLPYKWEPKEELLREAMAWRMFNLQCDMVVPIKFPAYFVNHKVKVPWLFHQFRQMYDLFETPFTGFSNNLPDGELRENLYLFDRFCLSESRHIFALSGNTRRRLLLYNEIDSEVLYSPSNLQQWLKPESYDDFILAVGRLEEVKRFDLLIEAVSRCRNPVKVRIAGTGSRLEYLKSLVTAHGLQQQIHFLGQVDSRSLANLYNTCRAVHFAPLDEDYGLVTLEAFTAGKAVITAEDAGGPLEFVEHEKNGFILPPEAGAHAGALDVLWENLDIARTCGEAGRASVEDISWENVVDSLLKWLPA